MTNTPQQLEDENWHLKETLNSIGAYIFTKSKDGIYTYVNQLVCDMFQKSADEIIGSSDADIFGQDKAEEFRKSDEAVLIDGQRIELEERVPISSHNEMGYFLTVKTPIRDQKGNIAGMVGVSTNITEQKKTEEKLKKVNNLLQTTLDTAEALIYIKNTNFEYTYANNAMLAQFGVSMEELNGKTDFDFMPEQMAKQCQMSDRKVLESGEKIYDNEVMTSDAGSIYYKSVKVPLLDNNEVYGYLGMSFDITDLQQLKNELESQNVKLQQLINEKNQFLGIVAHDLRNPLSGVQSMSQIIMSQTEDELHKMASFVHSATGKMFEMVSQLLDVSSIESGQMTLRKELTSLDKLIHKVVEQCEFIAHKKDIGLKLKSQAQNSMILIDPLKIEQVVTNLIDNAIKYSHPKTQVLVAVEKRDQKFVIRVSDQGLGIKDEEIAQIFTYFGKTSAVPTANESSHGLGLAICKNIVEAHDGEISVESTHLQGSTFTFTLPAVIA